MKVSIPEGLFLISLDDKEGRLAVRVEKHMRYALASAALVDLHLRGRVRFADGLVRLHSPAGTGNRLLDHVLATLPSPARSVLETVAFLEAHERDLTEEVVDLLVARGILERKAMRLMWLPVGARMENLNYDFEREIRNALRALLQRKTAAVDLSYLVLATLLVATDQLSELFQAHDARIDAEHVEHELLRKAPMDEVLREALQQLRSRLMERLRKPKA